MLGMKLLTHFLKCKYHYQSLNQIYFYSSESFVEDVNFPERPLAASVASKVFYYLEEFDEALRLALESGDLFDLNDRSRYVETLINKCIDRYIKLRQELTESATSQIVIDDKMERVIEKMFKRCFEDKKWKQAIEMGMLNQICQKNVTKIKFLPAGG